MLIAHGLLPDLISQLSSYSFFGIAPIFWDQNEGKFKVKKSAMTCIGTVITLQLGVCLLVHDLYLYHFSQAANNKSGEVDTSGGDTYIMEKAYIHIQRASCALLLFLVAMLHGRNMRNSQALVAFFNGMIAFEQKYTGRIRLPTDWKGKLTKYFCLLVRLSNNIGPLLISILITVSESSSPLNVIEFLTSSSYASASTDIGDSTVGNNNNNGGAGNNDLVSSFSAGITIITGNQMVERFITATLTALLNMIIWYMVVNIRGFWTCGQIFIGCYGIRSALNLYASIMTRGKLLRITKEKIQEALLYREIQLLTNLFNEVHGNSILAILLLLSSLLQTISLYLYVRFIATMTNSFYLVPSSWTWTSSRLFIAYVAFDGIFIVLVVFGCCAEVYLTSVQVKEQLQRNEVFQRSEWFTQFFLSCPTIKFKVGSTNFVSEGQLGCGFDSTSSPPLSSSITTSTTAIGTSTDSIMNMMTGNGNGVGNNNGGIADRNLNGHAKIAHVVNTNGKGAYYNNGCGHGHNGNGVTTPTRNF